MNPVTLVPALSDPFPRRGSCNVNMGARNRKAAKKRYRLNKIAKASRKRNRGAK